MSTDHPQSPLSASVSTLNDSAPTDSSASTDQLMQVAVKSGEQTHDQKRDKTFDQLSRKFRRNIYQTFKGKLRLAILERDFEALNLHQAPLSILDIGAGQGQYALMLAKKGHHLTLIEPAIEMLTLAQESFLREGLEANFYQESLEKLPELPLPQFDLITCHAMIEWLPEPERFLQLALPTLKPGGKLSLLFYNREGLIYHNLIRGNYYYVEKGQFQGEKGSLTPISPICPKWLKEQIEKYQLTLLKESGIRTYYDFMAPAARQRISEEDHLAMELRYSERSEYQGHARYLHWLLEK